MKPLPMRLGDLSVGFVQALADAVRSCAHDPAPLLEQFGLVEVFLPKPKEEKKAQHAPQQPKPELGVPEPAPVKAEVVVPAAVPVIVPEPVVAPVSEPVVPPATVEPVLPVEVPVTVPAVVAPVTPVVEPAAEPAITPVPAAVEPSTVQ